MTTPIAIHLLAAVYSLLTATLQLMMKKGTPLHRYLGRTWMVAMLITAISSFWISSHFPIWSSFGPIHLLSIWIIICVVISVSAARSHKIKRHKAYSIGAYVGLVGAGIGAFAPGRYLYLLFFGG